jgi:hypothetical protein
MRMLKNNLFFDTLNAFSIKVRMHTFTIVNMADQLWDNAFRGKNAD